MASKPGMCMKVLTIEPPQADCQLREDLALLADCALPSELRVRPCPGLWFKPRAWRFPFLSHSLALSALLSNSIPGAASSSRVS